MKPALLGALAAGTLTVSAAFAAGPTVTGGCFLQTASQRNVTGGAYGVEPVSLTDTDVATLCQDRGGPWDCRTFDHHPLPRPWHVDTVDPWSVVDPLRCPVLFGAQGGYGVVTVERDGDVVVTDPAAPVWDCPPYE